jgi:hypothetical protein
MSGDCTLVARTLGVGSDRPADDDAYKRGDAGEEVRELRRGYHGATLSKLVPQSFRGRTEINRVRVGARHGDQG